MIVRMGNNLGARLLMLLGFVAASLGYSAWIASRTVLDTGATAVAVRHIVDTPTVHDALRDQLRDALRSAIDVAPKDPRVATAIAAAANDPRITDAFVSAIVQLHHALLSNDAGTITLDPRIITNAMHDQLAKVDPTLAARLTPSDPLQVKFDAQKVPHLGHLRDTANQLRTLGLALAILLIGGSLMLDRSRKSIARLGRRLAYLAIMPLVVFSVAPRLLDGWGASGAQVGATALRAYSGRVVPSALLLVVVGLSTALIAIVAMPKMHASADGAGEDGFPAPIAAPLTTATPAAEPRVPEKLYL